MKKVLLALMVMLGVVSSAMAQYVVPADGGIAPDGSLDYVYPAGFPFQSVGPLYPMPLQYWIAGPESAVSSSKQSKGGLSVPMLPEQDR